MPRKKVVPAKPPPVVSTESTDNECGFTIEEEIAWCTKKLQQSLVVKYRDYKDLKAAKPIVIALKTLENKNNPLPKMRKMMRAGCGDYRKEMKEEFEKAKAETKKMSIDHENAAKGKKVSVVKSKKTEESEENNSSKDVPFCFNFPNPEEAQESDSKELK